MRRLLLVAVIAAALALAVVGAAVVPSPDRLPAIALGTALVWRVEVAAVLFVVSYGAIVTLRLALHGETLTRVGRDGIEVPRVGATGGATRATSDEVARSMVDLQETALTLTRRLESLEVAIDLVLRPNPEET